ncbi:HD domain-containing phosphohydrolase [Rubinisphaera italica]|uniref:Uncharacterized protein n=1 Tax=Rubinisphaera italica TaxID=2527969 RepID=A0A5C5XJD5_9PLAN|nr:HD domain-containing phosphohydrolase [Rubinisphaera italica]TWT62481.1 hypothetical protein Pan54_32230 [Rubinisphaera italica]
MRDEFTKFARSGSLPEPLAGIPIWEKFLENSLQAKSGCRVRETKLGQSPQAREQAFLKRLSGTARITLQKSAISTQAHRLQRQTLDLIQLRRRLIPDTSPAWQSIEVFLAAAQLHQALDILLSDVETLLELHNRVDNLFNATDELLSALSSGKSVGFVRVQTLVQSVINAAADSTIDQKLWLTLCSSIADYELNTTPSVRRLPLANALQASYLCAKLVRTETLKVKTEPLIAAALLKDTAFWHPQLSDHIIRKGHHSEWSAALTGNIKRYGPGLSRMIRQHHECLDGTGIPFGVRASDLHAEDRILGLITRWTELFQHQLKTRTSMMNTDQWTEDLQVCDDALKQEAKQNRWDIEWLKCLQIVLEIQPKPTEEIADPLVSGRNLNGWKVPQPKFMKHRFPILGNKSTSNVNAKLSSD